MGLHNIRRIDESSVFRLRPAECIHTCGTRVKGDNLPSAGPVCSIEDDAWVALRINNSTCYCCAARPATTITTILTRNAGPTDCGAHHDLTCANSQQSHQFHSKQTANTKIKHQYQILQPSEQQHCQYEPLESARRRHSVQEIRSVERRIGGHPR